MAWLLVTLNIGLCPFSVNSVKTVSKASTDVAALTFAIGSGKKIGVVIICDKTILHAVERHGCKGAGFIGVQCSRLFFG